jgi:hypothetical protein
MPRRATRLPTGNGQTLTAARFLADAERVAAQLPQRRHVVNLCVDRYRFSVGLIAALLRDQVSLLPPNQTPDMLRQLQRDYGGLYALSDSPQKLLTWNMWSTGKNPRRLLRCGHS